MQKSSYKFKVIIADDASSDGSLDIVRAYQARHNNIEILESKNNQKLYHNILRVYRALDTKYFCVLDPDDYWIDSNIIQDALDFLEGNSEFSIYCFNTKILSQSDNQLFNGEKMEWQDYNSGKTEHKYINFDKPREYNFRQYLECGPWGGHTSASFYRNVIFGKNTPRAMIELKSESNLASFRGDSFRNIVHLHEGKMQFNPRVVSVYRVHQKGIWQSLDRINQLILGIDFNIDMWEFYDRRYDEFLRFALWHYNEIFALESFRVLLFNAIIDNVSFAKMKDILAHLQRAHNILESNHIESSHTENRSIPKIKLKYKILKNIYYKLDKKLTRKGLVTKPQIINALELKNIFAKSMYFANSNNALENGGGGGEIAYFGYYSILRYIALEDSAKIDSIILDLQIMESTLLKDYKTYQDLNAA